MTKMKSYNNCKCCVCGGTKFSKLEFETLTSRIKESDGEFLLNCEKCGLIFSFPFPTIIYDKKFYDGKKPLGGSAGGAIKPPFHISERLNLVEKYFYPKYPLDILEIGCSTGVFLEYAKDRGHNVKGVEISEYAANIAIAKGLDVFIGKVEDANIPIKSVDFIHMNHVLEHLPDPLSHLRFLKHLLKNDGILVVEVPNEFENLQYRIKRYLKPNSLIRITPTQHSYFFSPKSLSYLFDMAGYRIQQITTPPRIKTQNPFVQIMAYLQDRLLLGNNIEIWGSPKT